MGGTLRTVAVDFCDEPHRRNADRAFATVTQLTSLRVPHLYLLRVTPEAAMKRFCLLAALMLLSSSAHAGGISFVIGGHRIHIDSVRCRSLSCVSVSGFSRREDIGDNCHPAKAAPATTAPVAAAPVASRPPVPAPAVPAAPPPIVVYKPAPVAPAQVVAPPPPAPPPPAPPPPAAPHLVTTPPPAVVTPTPPPAPPPPVVVPARPVPPVVRISHETDDEPDDGPIGDWQTETDSLVRIRLCGHALCGYALDKETRDLGEALLINMKPKQGTQWSGNVYSHDSGSTHYGTMEMKGTNTLRVEACAFGRFYCTGANWIRVSQTPRRLITERQIKAEPRS
jgi:hypothetical protein